VASREEQININVVLYLSAADVVILLYSSSRQSSISNSWLDKEIHCKIPR